MSDTHAAAHHGEGHATTKTYLTTFAILAVITFIELGAIFVHGPLLVMYAFVGALALIKFVMVCATFMHLKYDGKLVTFLFVSGLAVAFCTLLAFMGIKEIESLQPEKPRVAKAIKPPSADRGKKVFAEVGCTACHAVSSVPGAKANVGPALDGLADRAGTRVAGQNAEAYIKESIEKPDAFKVKGYENVQMAQLRDNMDDQEFADLVTWLLTLK